MNSLHGQETRAMRHSVYRVHLPWYPCNGNKPGADVWTSSEDVNVVTCERCLRTGAAALERVAGHYRPPTTDYARKRIAASNKLRFSLLERYHALRNPKPPEVGEPGPAPEPQNSPSKGFSPGPTREQRVAHERARQAALRRQNGE